MSLANSIQVGKGVFQSDLILCLFTWHIKQVDENMFDWEAPTGAMALVTTAVSIYMILVLCIFTCPL
jgi:hypothetical protein